MKRRLRSFVAVILAFCLLLPNSIVHANTASLFRGGKTEYGAYSGDMISGGGSMVNTSAGLCEISQDGSLTCGGRTLARGQAAALNCIGMSVFFARQGETQFELCEYDLSTDREEVLLQNLPGTCRAMYVTNRSKAYILTERGITCVNLLTGMSTDLVKREDIASFAICDYGIIIAVGELFSYDLFFAGRQVAEGVQSYYLEKDGETLVFRCADETYQVAMSDLLWGSYRATQYTGVGIVDFSEVLETIETIPKFEPLPIQTKRAASSPVVRNRMPLSQGVQNIVKRAYQMTNIQWTPKADITGWKFGLTYQAGTTYTGLPYGQPVDASYVPWTTSLPEFIAAVNNSSSKMYTSYANYNSQRAPYYSCDCSAFVSWAWNMPSRTTTSGIPSKAILVSSSSYADMQVGDCLCKAGEHVVLVTDITYDNSGAINGVEISESTVNSATYYCCQKTWYGSGHSYSLAQMQSKYLDNGYRLYRYENRNNTGYTHYCCVPLEGDSCSLCGAGSGYTVAAVYGRLTVLQYADAYNQPTLSSDIVANVSPDTDYRFTALAAGEDGSRWYNLENFGWVSDNVIQFREFLPSVSISGESFPLGKLESGQTFPVKGNISSINPIIRIEAAIYFGEGASGNPVQQKTVTFADGITSYSLMNSPIDIAMVFNALADGQYTFVLNITERGECPGVTSAELKTTRTSSFAVGTQQLGDVHNGIDVSHHQGTINWDQVASQIEFAVLRCGYGDDLTDQDDRQWEANVSACERLGIPYGVYLYSYALSDDQARSEAEHVLRLMKNHTPNLPIYLDLEADVIANNCSAADILRHAEIFCSMIEAAGYKTGIYADKSWWNTYLTSLTYDQWSRWVAIWGPSNPGLAVKYDMWQYSESGSLNGISGPVDLDYWYGDLPQQTHTHHYTLTDTNPAGCLSSGEIQYSCVCGVSYSETIPPIGHDYSDWVVRLPSTCTSEGSEISVCTRCSDQLERTLPKIEHEYQKTVIPPTCTEAGYDLYSCTRCGTHYSEQTADPLGHLYDKGVCIRCGALDTGVMKGDINLDGDITSADAVLLARHLVEVKLLTGAALIAADVNGDGDISSADAVLLAKMLVN